MTLARSPLLRGLVLVLVTALPAAAQSWDDGTIIARKLDDYQTPAALAVEPLDDNSETLAVAAALRKIAERRGFQVADDASFVLEIEVDPAVATGIGRPDEQTPRANRRMGTTNDGRDQLRQLAPTDELAPDPGGRGDRNRWSGVPQLAVVLNLYDADSIPVWTATVMARRNNRPLEEQSVQLALDAFSYFGRSNNDGDSAGR